MIAWGYRLWYPTRPTKDEYVLRVYPGRSRAEVRDFARDMTSGTNNKTKVVKVFVDEIPTCGCGLVDDLPVFCRRHSKGHRSSERRVAQ